MSQPDFLIDLDRYERIFNEPITRTLLLNIGLNRAYGGVVDKDTVLAALRDNQLDLVRARIGAYCGEPTLAAVVASYAQSAGSVAQRLRRVSIDCGQDCIAVYVPRTKQGALIGPCTERWGSFDLDKFIMP